MSLTIFDWPRVAARSPDYTLHVNGQTVELLTAIDGAVAIWDGEGPVEIEVRLRDRQLLERSVRVLPLRYGVEVERSASGFRFHLPGPSDAVIEVDDFPTLYLFYGQPLANSPHPGDPGVRILEAGRFHDLGLVRVGPGETLWIEGGAILHGAVRAENASGCRIGGRGIIDNRYFRRGSGQGHRNAILIADSEEVQVEGLTCIEPQTWTVKTANAAHVDIHHVRVVGDLQASDGIDITGSRHVRVSHCFVRSNDDCLAVKSVEYHWPEKRRDWCQDVEDILFEHCLLYKFGGGSAMELGHEFRCESVRDITFREIDVLAAHRFGSVFSIRNCDGATIENVLYENIRIDHHYNELIGFRIIRSRYSQSETRGHVRNVQLRHVAIQETPFNAGYTVSHIGGWDEGHVFENIGIEAMTFGGRPVRHPDDIDLYTKYCHNLTFR